LEPGDSDIQIWQKPVDLPYEDAAAMGGVALSTAVQVGSSTNLTTSSPDYGLRQFIFALAYLMNQSPYHSRYVAIYWQMKVTDFIG
jgi:hypothetical protein